MHFDLIDLRLVLLIAEARNLTKGADRMNLATSAASARLKSLEGQLGARLFYRDKRGMDPTEAGETLLRHARVILRQVEHLRADLGAEQLTTAGRIRIFANTTAVTEFMPELLARFLATHPGVTVDMQERLTRDIIRGVADGSTDLGITSGPLPPIGIQSKIFSTDRLVLVTPAGHPLSARRRLTFEATLDYEHITMREGATLHAFLFDLTDKLGRTLKARIQVSSFEALCRLIEGGVGIGVVPESAAHRHARTMKLSIVRLTDDWSLRERSVLAREFEALPLSARALVDELMKTGLGGRRLPPGRQGT